MADEPLPSGWLPPRPPAHPTSPEAPPRARGDWPPPPPSKSREPQQPSSPLAISAIGVGVSAILLLVFTAGVSYAISLVLALVAFTLSRQVQRRMRAGQPIRAGQAKAALTVSAIALGLAGLAALVWAILAANGITPADLQETLEREAQRLNGR